MPTPNSGYEAPAARYRYFSGAECIWKKELTRAYNCHLVFRKSFDCPNQLFAGELRVTASDTYRIYINGQPIGEGPARSERGECYVDHYRAADLPIAQGRNVIVVLALNKNLAEHGQPPKDAAFALTLEGHATDGSTLEIRTGKDWKVLVADWYKKPAPRRFFPVGFNEHIDFRKEPKEIHDLNYKDNDWECADIVSDKHLARCRPRPIPPYRYNHIFPKRVIRSGRVNSLDGIMGLAFNQTSGITAQRAYFKTWVYTDNPLVASVFLSCDNSAQVSVNGEQVWDQGDRDHNFRHHLSEYEAAWYEGMFHGHGLRMEPNPGHLEQSRCTLKSGWNALEVTIDFLDKAYGFELVFVDAQVERILLKNSAQQNKDDVNTWLWRTDDSNDWKPFETGDEDLRPMLEPSHLAFWEDRIPSPEPPNAHGLFRVNDEDAALTLQPGEFVEYELEAYAVGYLNIQLCGPAGTVVDFMIGERNDDQADRLPALNNGLWLMERITLSGEDDHYTGIERRGGRFISICVRQGSGPVKISMLMMRNLRYDNERQGDFTCSDPVLNWMWKTGYLTTELSTFDLSEDCPTREMAQWSGDSFIRTNLLACMWGDTQLSAKAIREFADDQTDQRWGRAMVPAGYGDSIVDYALLLPVWIWNHYEISGDRDIIPHVFVGVRNLLTFAAKLEENRGYLIPVERAKNQIYLDMKLVGAVRHLPNVAGLQAYYVKSLEHGAKLAELMNQQAMATQWREKAERLRTRINEDFWAVDASLFVNGEDEKGQLCTDICAETNYIMLWAGIPLPERADQIIKQLFPAPEQENMAHWVRGEGVYLKHFMADALLERGHAQEALTAWRGFYGSMMHQVPTIPEAWDRSWANALPTGHGATPSGNQPNLNQAALRSLVHPFGIGPMWHLMTYICGIKPADPGYRSILWAPMPGDLETIQAQFPLPGREDFVEIKMEPNEHRGRKLTLLSPRDITVEMDDRWLNSRDQMIVI